MISKPDYFYYSRNMTDKTQLKEKVEQGFIPCFNNSCSRHEHCLRWLGREFISDSQLAVTCVNPLVGGDDCEMYRLDEKVCMALGFTHLLEQLPRNMGKTLMQHLINTCNRTYAYEHRNGTRPIPPALQQHIIDFCRSQGWQGPVDFDAYEDQYEW